MEDFIKDFWDKFISIYKNTKELYILSEEYEPGFNSYIQPIKEQKDALDHIVRSYFRYISTPKLDIKDLEYMKANFQKSIGHIFRAFFDTCDILSITLREKLSAELKPFRYSEIIRVWPEYETERSYLAGLPQQIANMRQKKDIAQNSDNIFDLVSKYRAIIDRLHQIYIVFMKDIYPKLNA